MREPFLTPSLLARPIDVCGIENAILDLLLLTDDATVSSLGLHKGTMRLVETEEQARILEAVSGLDPEVEAGGSCANVLRVASLVGGVTSYSSAVGHDQNGRAFVEALARCAVRDHVARVDGRTGTSVILVTPDGERTMNTHLGVCRQYRPGVRADRGGPLRARSSSPPATSSTRRTRSRRSRPPSTPPAEPACASRWIWPIAS